MVVFLLCISLFQVVGTSGYNVTIDVNVDHYLHQSDDRFLSIAIDCSLIKDEWEEFDLVSPKAIALTGGLAPAILRLGGTRCDCVIFNSTVSELNSIQCSNSAFTLEARDWDKIVKLASTNNLTVLFDANVMLRTEEDNWDSTNFKQFLTYNAERRVKNLIFELGNEPNSLHIHFNKSIPPSQLASDFSTLRSLLRNDRSYRKSMLVGADIGSPRHLDLGFDPAQYMLEFLKRGHQYIDAFTWHQYYLKSATAQLDDFISPEVMSVYEKQIEAVKNIIDQAVGPNSSLPVWMGETSSASGGGAPNLSDTYVAGFLWMDKLGVASKHSYDIVIRQTFYGGDYSLVDEKLDPLPDYWLSLLYKRLVGARVLSLKMYDKSGLVRVYAHCTRYQNSNDNGKITLYAMNLNRNASVTFWPSIKYSSIDAYILEPVNGDLQSKQVQLDGILLQLDTNFHLPNIKPVSVDKITLEPLRFGFFVLQTFNLTACK